MLIRITYTPHTLLAVSIIIHNVHKSSLNNYIEEMFWGGKTIGRAIIIVSREG